MAHTFSAAHALIASYFWDHNNFASSKIGSHAREIDPAIAEFQIRRSYMAQNGDIDPQIDGPRGC